MFLQELTLKNFRSYSKRTFSFSQGTTVVIGPNTIGKTNILEAIFLTATGKSFRADQDREVIEWNEEVGRVKVKTQRPVIMSEAKDLTQIHNDDGDSSATPQNDKEPEVQQLEIVITTGQVMEQKTPMKKYLVNGISRRLIDFVGNLRAVLFWPEDLELVTDSPSLRRRYLDAVLIQVDREYRRNLYSYEKGLRQRNKLLERIRDEGINRSQLLFWDQLLIKTGNYIMTKREELINTFNHSAKPFGEFKIVYDLSSISSERLSQYAHEEVAAAMTLVGPHRDDLAFFESNRNLAKFGSRGEQRLIVLWLKIAELEYISQVTQERPILLLDDIFSELDHMHREEIAKIVGLQQTILTTTDVHFLPEGLFREANVIQLEQ